MAATATVDCLRCRLSGCHAFPCHERGADLKAVYAAVDESTALEAVEVFAQRWDKKYLKISVSWRDTWANLSTYFKFPQEVRRLIYTTNAIEGFNRQLRKVTKAKSVFPTDDNLLKMLYLAMMDITKNGLGGVRTGVCHAQLAVYFSDRGYPKFCAMRLQALRCT